MYTIFQKMLTFLFHYSFYRWWPISIIFGAQYTEVICNITIIDLSTSPAYCCYITLGNINFWFLDHFGWFVPSTKLFKWLWNVMMKSDQWHIFTVAFYHDVELNAGAIDASFTCSINVTLTSSSNAVFQHTDVCIRQLSYCSVKLQSLLLWG